MLGLLLLISGVLFCLSLSWSSFLGFWLTIEAAGLIIVCGFFDMSDYTNRYIGLLNYLLVSGVSASLIFVGLSESYLSLAIIIGFILKVGLFPFMGWVVSVYNNSSWQLLFYLAVVSKVTLLYLPLLVSGHVNKGWLNVCFILTFLILSAMLWYQCSNVKTYIAISSIGSGSFLMVVLFSCNYNSGLTLYVCYFITMLVNFMVFKYIESTSFRGYELSMLFFLVLAIPCALVFIYKFVSVMVAMGAPILIIFGWVLFSVSEQFYLSLILIEKSVTNFSW